MHTFYLSRERASAHAYRDHRVRASRQSRQANPVPRFASAHLAYYLCEISRAVKGRRCQKRRFRRHFQPSVIKRRKVKKCVPAKISFAPVIRKMSGKMRIANMGRTKLIV